MQITIHRATQIGGQITRISTAHASIIIDLGHNLPNRAEDEDVYDNDRAIARITEGCSAILYTHYHGDHIGLFHHAIMFLAKRIRPMQVSTCLKDCF